MAERSALYGNQITTQYGRESQRCRSVVGEIGTAPAGNLTLRVGRLRAPEGHEEPKGWEVTEHVVLTPVEAVAFLVDVLGTLIEHERNRELFVGRELDALGDAQELLEAVVPEQDGGSVR